MVDLLNKRLHGSSLLCEDSVGLANTALMTEHNPLDNRVSLLPGPTLIEGSLEHSPNSTIPSSQPPTLFRDLNWLNGCLSVTLLGVQFSDN